MTNEIAIAVRLLRDGGLVAFPTETVYGLGADATNPTAIARIFSTKGRPPTNPLIVHVAARNSATRYASAWNESAERLAERFWPGPLALVVPKAPQIVPGVSGGLETVALRCPDHPMALDLLRAFDGPIAAPSANRSTRVSPTTAEHVREELGEAVDLILDGGACRVGIESTVLDLSRDVPTILRPGAITREQIEAIIGPVEVFSSSVSPSAVAVSPGQHAIHYAPRTPAFRFEHHEAQVVAKWCEKTPASTRVLLGLSPAEGCLTLLPQAKFFQRLDLADASSPDAYARDLYAALRQLDVPGVAAMLIEMPPDRPEWTAVRDRLTRATRPIGDLLRSSEG